MRTTTKELSASWGGFRAFTIATAAMYVGGALLLAVSLLTWREGMNPPLLLAVMLVGSSIFATYTLRTDAALTTRQGAIMTAGGVFAIGLLTWNTDIMLTAYANGVGLPMIAIYSAWFLDPRTGRTVVFGGSLWWFVAIAHHGDTTLTAVGFSVITQVVLVHEIFLRIKRRQDRVARTDMLTGTANRWVVVEAIDTAAVRLLDQGEPFSIISIDVDGLREVNNLHGHQAGDEMLEGLAKHWLSRVRRHDVLGRIGGDEFVVVLPNTGVGGADEVAERLREDSPASFSVGIAQARVEDTLISLFARADRRLYADKLSRRLTSAQTPAPVGG